MTSMYNGGLSILGLSAISSSVWFSFFLLFENANKNKENKTIVNIFNGAASSVATTIIINPIQVLKTYRQTKHLSYIESIKDMINKTTILNTLYRGVSSRMLIKGIQSGLFVMLWKQFETI